MAFDPSKVDIGSLSQVAPGENVEDDAVNDSLNFNMSEAVKVNPDQHAKELNLSKQSGIPVIGVQSDPVAVEQDIKKSQFDFSELRKTNPVTANRFNDIDNAIIAQDDVDVMKSIENIFNFEKTFKSFGESTSLGYSALEKSSLLVGADITPSKIQDLIPASRLPFGMEQVAQSESKALAVRMGIDTDEELQQAKSDATDKLLTELRSLNEKRADIAPEDLNLLEQGVRGGIESLVNMAPGFALMLLSGGRSAPLLATMGVQTFSSSYGQGRAEGLTPGEAGWYAGIDATIEVGTEMLPTGVLETIITGKSTGLKKDALKFMVREMGTEQLATLGQSINAYAFDLDEQINNAETVSEMVDIQLQRQAVTAIATVVAGGAQITAATTIRKTIDAVIRDETVSESKGAVEQSKIDQLNEKSQESKLKERDKESFKQFVNEADGENNTNVFIDGSQVSLYLQTKTPAEIEADPALKLLSEQAAEASALDSDVQIPVADFAAEIAATDHFEQLRDSMTMSDETVSPFRQEQAKQETDNYIKVLMEEAQENTSEYVDAQEISQAVRQQLIDTGVYSPKVASTMAEMVPLYFAAKAKREGITVVEAYQNAGFIVEGPQTGERARLEGEQVLSQAKSSGFKGESVVEASEFKQAVDKGLDMSQEARLQRAEEMGFDTENVLYHTTDREFEGFRQDPVGIWFADSPIESRVAADVEGKGEQQIPVYLKKLNLFNYDGREPSPELTAELINKGYEGMSLPSIGIGNDIIIFDPSKIRSVNASFDPDFKASANLLAQQDITDLPESLKPQAGLAEEDFIETDTTPASLQRQQGFELDPDFVSQPIKTDPDAFTLGQRTDSKTARGYYDPANSIIRLTESADLSTFLHEFAHFMYEMEFKGDTEMLKSINNWYKRNADDVAKEANSYLGDKFDVLKQGGEGLNAFDNTTTEMPFYDDMMRLPEYFEEQKGKVWKIVNVTPFNYLKSLNIDVNNKKVIDIEAKHYPNYIEPEAVDDYTEKMKAGEKFPMLTYDVSEGRVSQEGRHRALAAIKAGVKTVPVLIVEATEKEAELAGFKKPKLPDAIANEQFAQPTDQPTAKEGSITADDVIIFLDSNTTGDRDKDAAIRRAVHEQFARGFEAYLMEGKAPSIELRNAFRAFARWLSRIYQALRGQLNVNLDNQMREVFDRLLATEEQIQAAQARARVEPMFSDATMAGMTDEEFADYQARKEKVKDVQSETLRDKIIKQLTRQTKEWWKVEKQDIIDEELQSLSKEQVYKAREELKNGAFKIDHAAVKAMTGEERTNKLGHKRTIIPPALSGMTAKGMKGVHPDEAAAFFGYGSGSEMLIDLITAPAIKDQAKVNAEAKMVERHGDILTDGTIEREADEAVRDEERGKLLLHELKMVARGTNAPTIDRATIKALAEERIGRLSFREIHPGKYRKAEIRAAQESARMLVEGNREGAAAAKMRQVLNYYLGMAATAAKNDTVKIVDRMSRYSKKKVREAIMKAEGGYWDQIVKILERFEFRKSATLKDVDSINLWAKERLEKHGEELVLSKQVLNESYVIHWKNVPFTDLQGINDSVKNIEYVAKYANKITLLKESIEFDKLKSKIINHLDKLDTVFRPERTTGKDETGYTLLEKITGKVKWTERVSSEGVSWMSKVPFMTFWLDKGEPAGLMTSLIHRPTVVARDEELTLWESTALPLITAIKNRPNTDLKRMHQKIYIPEIAAVDEDNVPVNTYLYGHQILSVALNAGNAGNLRKMLLGEGWANPDNEAEITINNPKLQAVLDHMTESDWSIVKQVWDSMDSLYPLLSETTLKGTGLTPKKVDPVEFQTKFGKMKGGYYTLQYDHDRDARAADFKDKREARLESMFSTLGSLNQSVTAGATHTRTEFYAPIRFDLGVITDHFQEVIHYITHYDTVRQVNKIIRDPVISMKLKRKLGKEEYAKMNVWLSSVAKGGRATEAQVFGSNLARHLRTGMTYVYLGYKLSTILIQPSGLFTARTLMMEGKGYIPQGIMSMLKTIPINGQEGWAARDFALLKSSVLRHRLKTFDREFNDAMKQIEVKEGKIASFRRASMMGIGYVQLYVVDFPVWHAGFEKGMVDFEGDESKAVEYADWLVDQSQGSGDISNMSAMLGTNNQIARLFFSFMTWFNTAFNVQRTLVRGKKQGWVSSSQFAAGIFYMIFATTMYELLIRGEAEPEEDEEPDEYMKRIMSKMASTTIGTVPYARDAANVFVSDYHKFNASPAFNLVGNGLESIYGAASNLYEGEEVTRAQQKGIFTFAATIFHIPGAAQTWATSDEIYQYLEEGEEITLKELAFGPDRE